MSTRRAARETGFTLVEVLVGATLALMVLGVILQLVISSTKVSGKATRRVDLQQKALLLNTRLERDLRLTAINGFEIQAGTDGSMLSIHPRKNDLSAIVWESHTIFYELTGGRLWAKELPFAGPTNVGFKPQGSQWSSLQSTPGRTTLRLDSVTRFEAVVQSGALVRLNVSLVDQDDHLDVERFILLRQGS